MTPTTSFSDAHCEIIYSSQWIFLANARFLMNSSTDSISIWLRHAIYSNTRDSYKFECIFAEFIKMRAIFHDDLYNTPSDLDWKLKGKDSMRRTHLQTDDIRIIEMVSIFVCVRSNEF